MTPSTERPTTERPSTDGPGFWRPWVPYPVAAQLCAGRDPAEVSHHGEGAVLFADVSGFTALGEALAPRGPGGAELLHQALVDAFTPLVRKIARAGGWVAKFGGDALTAVFDGPDALAAAAACALDLQRGVARAALRPGAAPELAAHRLALKVGVGQGAVSWCLAGDPERRLELLLWGTALERAVAAEHGASRGDVIASALPVGFDGVAHPSGVQLRAGPERPPAPRRSPLQGDHPAGAAFLHPIIAQRLRLGHARFVQEHRRVTVAFVRFSAEPGESALREPTLRGRVRALVDAVGRWGGHLDKVDLGDKGDVALVLFGAPVSHEDDAERAVRLCLELDGLFGGVSAGLHAGLVFAGAFGAPERHEYTVLGDAVNLAARLMQAAGPGVVLASREVVAPFASRLDTAPPVELQVKGRAAPVTALAVRGFRRTGLVRDRAATPFVGRRAELAAGVRTARAALRGRGRTLAVVGDAGLGKSRLVEELLRECEGLGFSVSGGAAQPHAQEPWEVWQDVWRALLPWSPVEGIGAIRQRLRVMGSGHDVRAPLLAGPLGAPVPPSKALDGLDDAARFRATVDVLASVLETASQRCPRVIVLDDAHWLDAPSRELLLALCPIVAHLPVLLVVVLRPDARELVRELAARPGVDSWSLGPLPGDAAAELARHHWGGDAVPAELVERAGGNPFYVEELVRWVRGRGEGAPLELPRSLAALVQARLDGLADDDRLTLKAASVIGRRFRLRWLVACCPELGDAGGVAQRLEHLARLEITPADEDAQTWRFRHAVTRETAYATLTDATRRELHERLATALAASPDPDPTQVAWHFSQTDDLAGQRVWYRRAGAAAVRANDPAAGVAWYERWLLLGGDEGRAAVLHELAGLAFRAGAPARAEARWAEALPLAGGDVALLGAIRVGLATVWADAGRRVEARAAAQEALAAFEAAGLVSADRVSAMLFLAQLGRDTDQAGAADLARRAFALAETLQEPWSAGRAAAAVGIVLLRRPEDVPEAEPWLLRARALSEAAEDPVGVARALSNQAVACWWTGRAREATAAWGRTVTELLRVGDVAGAWTVYGNLAQVHLNRRSVVTTRPMQALRCDHDTRTGRWSVAASGLPSLLQTAYFHPDLWEPAAEHAPLVVAIAEAAGTPYWRAVALGSAVMLAWRVGRDADALRWARACLQLPAGALVDEPQGWAACWGQLAGRRLGQWSPDDDAAVAAVEARASERTQGYFAAARALGGRDVDASLLALDRACDEHGDVFLHAIREVAWGRPMDPPPPLEPPPELGRAPVDWAELFAAVKERWARRG